MNAVRPLTRDELPEVASLYERVMRSGRRTPAGGLEEMLARLLFETPWEDPEIPSLVVVENGAISGFLGSHVRHLSLEGRPARLACSGQLVVDPDARHPALGAILLGAYLQGTQDITITDGATDIVRRMWTRLGGQVAHPHGIEWLLPLRPWRLGAHLVGERRGTPRPRSARGGAILTALDRLSLPVLGRLVRSVASPAAPAAGVTTEPLTAMSLVEQVASLGETLRLTPAYDPAFADWLLREMSRVSERGQLTARLVRRDGMVAGWYVYYLAPGGLSPVIQLAGRDEAAVTVVVEALLAHARQGGAAALEGRAEDRVLQTLRRQNALLRSSGNALIHARDPALIALATSHASLLTRMEGEWWMGPHLLPDDP